MGESTARDIGGGGGGFYLWQPGMSSFRLLYRQLI